MASGKIQRKSADFEKLWKLKTISSRNSKKLAFRHVSHAGASNSFLDSCFHVHAKRNARFARILLFSVPAHSAPTQNDTSGIKETMQVMSCIRSQRLRLAIRMPLQSSIPAVPTRGARRHATKQAGIREHTTQQHGAAGRRVLPHALAQLTNTTASG